MSAAARPNAQNCWTRTGTVGSTKGADANACDFSSGSGSTRCLEHAFGAIAERYLLLPRALRQHGVAGAPKGLGERAIARRIARLVEDQVEYDRFGAAGHQAVDELRMQVARPRVELARLPDGGGRIARDADDDDLVRRRYRPSHGEQQPEPERLVEGKRPRQETQRGAADSKRRRERYSPRATPGAATVSHSPA